MTRNYTVSTRINKPAAEVYRAIVKGETLCRYFTDATSGDLKPGETVQWTWNEWGTNKVVVSRVEQDALIELELDSNNWCKAKASYTVTVTIALEALENGATMVSISEAGWPIDAEGLKGSHDNCGGWQHMLMCLKGWLEYGIDLRR